MSTLAGTTKRDGFALRWPPFLSNRIAGQSALVFSGLAAAQVFSFLRNAVLGHTLSPGHFGIAATLTLTLQLLEALSDPGADKLIVQDRNGAMRSVLGTVQTILIARGLGIALILALAAIPLAAFYRIPEATLAFAALALAPAIKGAVHLDLRRQQRHLRNTVFIATELAPQAIALAATLPVVWLMPNFGAVAVLALVQSITAVAVSHGLARRPYRLAWSRQTAMDALKFCWPIWLSALPLIAVYQGDRILVGRLLGMEDLARYSAAFMVTMVPGLLVARAGNAILLPLFSAQRTNPPAFFARLRQAWFATGSITLAYFVSFALLGAWTLEIAFGSNYAGLGAVMTALALMWSVRMLQVVPGMAVIAVGDTRTLLFAGILRATALLPAALVLSAGGGLTEIALIGCAGEFASLAFMSVRTWQFTRRTSSATHRGGPPQTTEKQKCEHKALNQVPWRTPWAAPPRRANARS